MRFALRGAWGSGPNDVWVVGASGRILHFDGTGWSSVSHGLSVAMDLRAIWGSGAGDLVVVGNLPEAWHFDGATTPALHPGTLYALWGSGWDDVWAAGYSGVALHFDGYEWSFVSALAGQGFIRSIWGSGPGDVYLASQNGILHFDGSQGISVAHVLQLEVPLQR